MVNILKSVIDVKMKYLKESEELLRSCLYEDWMDESDWDEFKEVIFKVTGYDLHKISQEFEEGIKNGYTIEQQTNILKKIFKI